MTNYFPKEETQCSCGCGGDITEDFRFFLNSVRSDVGQPLILNSGFRCTAFDSSIGGKGVHPTGKAADVACSGPLAHKVLQAALKHGATGVGVSQKGAHSSRFIHLDITEGSMRSWIWSY